MNNENIANLNPAHFTADEIAERDRRILATDKLIVKRNAAITRNARKTTTFRMQCNECGKKFNARGINGRCPKCRGCDFEPVG